MKKKEDLEEGEVGEGERCSMRQVNLSRREERRRVEGQMNSECFYLECEV